MQVESWLMTHFLTLCSRGQFQWFDMADERGEIHILLQPNLKTRNLAINYFCKTITR